MKQTTREAVEGLLAAAEDLCDDYLRSRRDGDAQPMCPRDLLLAIEHLKHAAAKARAALDAGGAG